MKPIFSVLCLSLLVGCAGVYSSRFSDQTKRVTVKVGAEKVDCVGVAPMKCLVVDGLLFYSEIQGFDFKPGFEYELEIERTQVYTNSNAPADLSLYEYKLVNILNKKKTMF